MADDILAPAICADIKRILNFDCGIYTITSPSGRKYIGQATSFYLRWCTHRARLRAGKHHCEALQRAWDKYGEENMVFAKIAIVPPDDLNVREQEQIDSYVITGRRDELYNTALFVEGSARGIKRSAETRRRMSESQRGEKNHQWGKEASPETRAKLSAERKSRTYHPSQWMPMVLANTGIPKSAAAREKMAAAKRGKRQSEETRAKRSASQTGARNYKALPVLCVETGLIFGSAGEAARWLRESGHPKASHTAISAARSGLRNIAYGYTWRLPDEQHQAT